MTRQEKENYVYSLLEKKHKETDWNNLEVLNLILLTQDNFSINIYMKTRA